MAKIYTSYKYKDVSVRPLPGVNGTTVRQYVDLLQLYLDAHEHINKGEEDDEDLSALSDESIEALLRDRMFDSSVTIVLISKNMKEDKSERDQWIPWEIAYSLKETTREERTSRTNAVLAVVIPDESDSYGYFMQENICCTRWPTCPVFKIIRRNIFNHKEPKKIVCEHGETHIDEDHSYIYIVKWDDFIKDVDIYLNRAIHINENINDYDIKKEIV